MDENVAIRNAKNFDELLDIEYGKVGTEKRDRFERKAKQFLNSELADVKQLLSKN